MLLIMRCSLSMRNIVSARAPSAIKTIRPGRSSIQRDNCACPIRLRPKHTALTWFHHKIYKPSSPAKTLSRPSTIHHRRKRLPSISTRLSLHHRYRALRSKNPVQLVADSSLANKLPSTSTISDFQLKPTGQSQTFQAVHNPTTVVPWHYFVLSPLNTVTAVADQQLLVTLFIAFGMSTLVALLGLIV